MASDGPSKPLVPPPPTLSFSPGSAAKNKPAALPEDDGWLELIADEPKTPKDTAPESSESDVPSPAAPIDSPERAPDLPSKDTTGPTRTVRREPPPRRGLLPPPNSDGKRVQPVLAKPRPEPTARPSAAGLPSGMRPPGAPHATKREDTDVLIASAVAILTEGEDVPDEEGDAALAPAEAPAPDPVVLTPVAARVSGDEPDDSRRLGVWIGLGAVAALVVALIAAGSGDDEAPEATSAAAVVADADPAGPPEPVAASPEETVAAVPAPLAPDLGAPSPTPDVGSEVLALADALDVGGDEPKLDLGSGDVELALAEEPAEQRDTPQGRTKRRRKPKAAAAEPARPAPAAPATTNPDADALLTDARNALAAGRARKAYTLASKSRSAKRTSAALVVMAKAACRLGDEAQAKSAFDQLSVSARRGIRSECRSHGVRLGL